MSAYTSKVVRRKVTLKKSERGVAILLVLTIITMVTAIVSDFQYNSSVDYEMAINARDEVQAEYNAWSALRLRVLLLRQGGKIKTAMGSLSKLIGQDMNKMLPIGKLMETIPVECGLMSGFLKREGSEEDDELEPVLNGECLATAQSEHSKVSINMLRKKSKSTTKALTAVLVGMLSDPKLE